jgi:hypothetical protein
MKKTAYESPCVLFVRDGVKRRPLQIIRYHVRIERNTGEKYEKLIVRKFIKQIMGLPAEFSAGVTRVQFKILY